MKQEEKELLIKDFCARLPYGVKVRHEHLSKIGILYDISMCGDITIDYSTYNHFGNINDTKPYLFPLSSMTEEQKRIYNSICNMNGWDMSFCEAQELIDWINANHFHYRGLIEKGLALDATNLNIY